jgi:phosphoribosyl 1,2-cyclic phosphate phosphodiesterase
VLVEVNGVTIVIDSGPDFRQQMLRAEVKNLDALIFTHEHKDHIAGMDDIRAFNYVLKRNMDVYATERVQKALHREFPYVFEDLKYPGVPEINMHTITEESFVVKGVNIQPIEVLHYRLPVLGFRIGDFTYITDANAIPEKAMEQIRGSKVVVINALRKEKHVSHFTLDEAVSVINQLGPQQAYLTHISHQLGTQAEVDAVLGKNISCAYDGLTIDL